MKPRRVLFVTVGTTALSAEKLGGTERGAADVRRDAREFLDTGRLPPNLYQRVLDAHDLFWKSGLAVFKNRYRTSAEMASSYYALRVQGNEHLFTPGKDRIVLLSSATDQGGFCAKVNEQLMKSYLFVPPNEARESYIEPIEGLDAKKGCFTYNIATSLEKIWSRHEASEETIINITGGFKGTVPALTWRLYRTKTENKRMIYAHESMDRVEVVKFKDNELDQNQVDPEVMV